MHWDYYCSTFDMCINCGGYAPYDYENTYCDECREKMKKKNKEKIKYEPTQ